MATRANLRDRARIRADQDASTFPTDTQYNTLLDEAGKEAWYDLIQAGWPVNFSHVDKTATGAQTIALGASGTVAFVRGVYRKDGTTYTELRRVNEGDRASLMSTLGNQAEFYDVRYDMTDGLVVELLPVPSSGSYRVEYVTEWAGFTDDTSAWMGPARSDELVVLRAAAKGMRKEGNDQGAAQLDREYDLLFEKVTNMASWLDMRNPPVIRDVNSGLGRLRDPFDYDVQV